MNRRQNFQLHSAHDMFMAVRVGDLSWLNQVLKSNESYVNLNDERGLTCLHVAALECRCDILKSLLIDYQVDVNLSTSSGWTALHFSINSSKVKKSYECVQYLLGQGADVNRCTSALIYPLHLAASCGHVTAIELLLKHNAVVDVTDKRGQSPYIMAMIWGHKNAARVLAHSVWMKTKQDEAYQRQAFQKYCAKIDKEKRTNNELVETEKKLRAEKCYQNWLQKNCLVVNNLLGLEAKKEKEAAVSVISEEKGIKYTPVRTRKDRQSTSDVVELDRHVKLVQLSTLMKH